MAADLSNSSQESTSGLPVCRKPVTTNPVRFRTIRRFVQEKRRTRMREAVCGETSSHAGMALVYARREGNSIRAFARRYSASVHPRSEEHTSELQSHSDLVCRLLLEKKK